VKDLETLTALFERDPFNPVLLAMLTDELITSGGMNRTEADQKLQRVQLVARQAAELREAGTLMTPGTDSGRYLLRELMRVTAVPDGWACSAVLLSDGAEPFRTEPTVSEVTGLWGATVIYAPARWVITCWETRVLVQQKEAARARRRRPAK
jgi:hypothetical protein